MLIIIITGEKKLLKTFDMCTPKLLWIPEHCMHMKIPRLTLAHLGPLQDNEPKLGSTKKSRK